MSTKNRNRQLDATAGHQEQANPKLGGVAHRILDAALNVLAESGLRNLTQVEVANRAKVRQSHLTYYFPTRDHLLNAVTKRAVNGIVSGFRRVATQRAKGNQKQLLERLARSVVDLAHMRMFVAMIVEADADHTVRRVMRRATERIEAALAEALGGDDARERARLVLAAIWGLGLYQFLMRPASNASATRAYLSWLAEASKRPQAAYVRRTDA
jgi:AcrR family transcriptional regulator